MTTRNTVNEVSNVRLRVWFVLSLTIFRVNAGVLAADLADPVEDHDRVVDRVADDRQEGGHDRSG